MRIHWLLAVAVAAILAGCLEEARDYPQRIVGSWRMAGTVMGKPANGVLHILNEGDYLLDNRDSDRVAKVQAPDSGRWSLLRDELALLAVEASPLSGVGLEQVPVRLHIVSLDDTRLVTADPDYGVKIEWVRVGPLN